METRSELLFASSAPFLFAGWLPLGANNPALLLRRLGAKTEPKQRVGEEEEEGSPRMRPDKVRYYNGRARAKAAVKNVPQEKAAAKKAGQSAQARPSSAGRAESPLCLRKTRSCIAITGRYQLCGSAGAAAKMRIRFERPLFIAQEKAFSSTGAGVYVATCRRLISSIFAITVASNATALFAQRVDFPRYQNPLLKEPTFTWAYFI